MPLQITLNWQGPYGLASAELRRAFLPPEQPGLYLWTVGAAGADRYQVSYVGETGNISTRMHTHVTSILGGAYYLYDDDHMTRGADPNRRERWVYQPTFRNLLEHFLNDYDRFSKAAVRNLAGYTFFWAVPEPTVTREVRQSIESALIASLQEEKVPIQNDRPSVGPARAWRVQLSSISPSGISIRGLRARCEYGTIE